jgi:hypothetical protein
LGLAGVLFRSRTHCGDGGGGEDIVWVVGLLMASW